MPTKPRISLIQEARHITVACLLTSGVTFLLMGFTDPFGKSAKAARDATEVVICTSLASNQQRLQQLREHIREGGIESLTRNERDVYVLQQASHGRLVKALHQIRGECKLSENGGIEQ